jgi:Tfp pilus assembly protein PilF
MSKHEYRKRSGAIWPWFVALGLSACGGSPAPAHQPEGTPEVTEESEGTPPADKGAAAPASNAKVKRGMDAIQAGDFEKAKTVLSEAVKDNPEDPQAAFYLGVAFEALGDRRAAAEQYKRALGFDPKLTEASINLSGVLLDAEDTPAALSTAEAGLKYAPKNPALLRNRAVALDAAGKNEAVQAFKEALDAAPDDQEVHYLYGEALARHGDEARAVKELEGLVGSDDVAVLASTGRLLGKLKAFDACIAALDRAVAKKNASELLVQRGICKHGKKDDKAAAADFEAAISADPSFAPAHYYLAQNERARGNKKRAKAEFEKTAELDPSGNVGSAAKKALAELK